MKISTPILGLVLAGLASSTACAVETNVDERSSAVLTQQDLAILGGGDDTAACKWHCKQCPADGNCESECFPTGNCESESECGFLGFCDAGYAWSEDECTCVEGREPPVECGFTGICKIGWTWDEAVCNCVPGGLTNPTSPT